MRSKLFTLAVASAIGAAGGCAWSDQRVPLRPTIPFPRSEIGAGRFVELHIADARPRAEIGRRIGPGRGGSITANPDMEAMMRNVIGDALERKGFRVAPSGTAAAATLSIELRNFEYEVASKGISNNTRVWAMVEATCRNSEREYENFYREHSDRDRRSLPLTAESNEVLLNETFSGVLRKPFADRDLIDCLAGPETSADRSDQTP